MTEAEAIAELADLCDATVYPLLTTDELTLIVRRVAIVDEGGRLPADTGWLGAYDLNRAALAGWRKKMGKASGDFGFSADGARFDRNQVIEHCRLMVDEYRRKIAGVLQVVR